MVISVDLMEPCSVNGSHIETIAVESREVPEDLPVRFRSSSKLHDSRF